MSDEGHMRIINACRALEADSVGSLSALRSHLSHKCRWREELARDREADCARLRRRAADHVAARLAGLVIGVLLIFGMATWTVSQFL